jgi:hypothetical protein
VCALLHWCWQLSLTCGSIQYPLAPISTAQEPSQFFFFTGKKKKERKKESEMCGERFSCLVPLQFSLQAQVDLADCRMRAVMRPADSDPILSLLRFSGVQSNRLNKS